MFNPEVVPPVKQEKQKSEELFNPEVIPQRETGESKEVVQASNEIAEVTKAVEVSDNRRLADLRASAEKKELSPEAEEYLLEQKLFQIKMKKLETEIEEKAAIVMAKYGDFLRSCRFYGSFSPASNSMDLFEDFVTQEKRIGGSFQMFSKNRRKLKVMLEDDDFLALREVCARNKNFWEQKRK